MRSSSRAVENEKSDLRLRLLYPSFLILSSSSDSME